MIAALGLLQQPSAFKLAALVMPTTTLLPWLLYRRFTTPGRDRQRFRPNMIMLPRPAAMTGLRSQHSLLIKQGDLVRAAGEWGGSRQNGSWNQPEQTSKNSDDTFIAGALIGLAGGALLSAVQEALHANDR